MVEVFVVVTERLVELGCRFEGMRGRIEGRVFICRCKGNARSEFVINEYRGVCM